VQPLGGERSNHSGVDFVAPDLARHPAYADARPQVVTLRAGDALFLPEGWWHQVDSDGTTIAVNFWCGRPAACRPVNHGPDRNWPVCRWDSEFTERLDGVMDAYFARRACESLVAAEKVRAEVADGEHLLFAVAV
jgi:hypothetical protein